VILEITLFGLAGLCVGSFLNVCIHRLPRRESLIFPASRCPCCGTALRPWELVPVLSYLWLRGRCASCGERISGRYTLVELLSAAGWVAVGAVRGPTLAAAADLVLLSVLIVAAFADLETQLIPDRLTLPGTLAGLVFVALRPAGLASALGGLGLGGGVLLLLALVSGGGMGGGDVKLAALMGVFLGWPRIAAALAVAFLAGGMTGLALVLTGRKARRDRIPFGPFLALGGVTALFWGEALIRWYLAGLGR